jgi:hypothetical protein
MPGATSSRASRGGCPRTSAPGPGDRRLNQGLVIDCGGRAIGDITPVLAVDRRVLVVRIENGSTYLVLEAPLDQTRALAVEQGLLEAGRDPGPVDGIIDERSRRAVAEYARDHGAAFAFEAGVVTENVLAALLTDSDPSRRGGA